MMSAEFITLFMESESTEFCDGPITLKTYSFPSLNIETYLV